MLSGSKTVTGGILGRDNSPTGTVVRRSLLTADFLPTRTPYSSVTSEPGGGILRSNTIAGVSSMSVSRDMCGRSWLYHCMNLVSGSDSILVR